VPGANGFGGGGQDSGVAAQSIAEVRVDIVGVVVPLVRENGWTPIFQRLSNDARRKRHEESAATGEKRRAERVFEAAVVDVDTEQAATLFNHDFHLPFHECRLRERIGAYQQSVRVGPLDFVSAHLLDVVLVFGVDGFVELEVGEVEVDVLVCLSGAHHAIPRDVGAAEADEQARQGHWSILAAIP
jgi:hypothetical protein